MTAPLGLTWDAVANARIIDLAHPLERGMPVSPNHPAFQIAMMRRHGDMVRSDGGSAANEMFLLGGHVGTHIDALGHVSQDGLLYGGIDADSSQSNHGLTNLGVDTVDPILCRGILLDIAAYHDTDVLEPGYEVTVADLEGAADMVGVTVSPEDAVLIRTGWANHWADVDLFRGQVAGAPGPGEEAGKWLVDHKARVTGAETIAFEVIRPGEGHATLPVHRKLLVEAGINIIEVMDLTALARSGIHEFLFVAAPLKIVGGTGSPMRPIAVVDA
jgi:kynurenine formamidase